MKTFNSLGELKRKYPVGRVGEKVRVLNYTIHDEWINTELNTTFPGTHEEASKFNKETNKDFLKRKCKRRTR